MDISNCKGCDQVIYATDPKKSWCWKLSQEIKDIEKCPVNYEPLPPKGRKQGWSNDKD